MLDTESFELSYKLAFVVTYSFIDVLELIEVVVMMNEYYLAIVFVGIMKGCNVGLRGEGWVVEFDERFGEGQVVRFEFEKIGFEKMFHVTNKNIKARITMD